MILDLLALLVVAEIAPLNLSASSTSNTPVITIDKTTFQAGTVPEGPHNKIDAVFVVKNTGAAPLRITSANPECGCTVATFDSVIKPGMTGKISATVYLKGIHGGPMRKSLVISSNAPNKPAVDLFIEATIQNAITVSTDLLNLSAKKANAPQLVSFVTARKDLKIVSVGFISMTDGVPGFHSGSKTPIKYTWTMFDSTAGTGNHTFHLGIFAPASPVRILFGDLVIKTNHPDRPEVVLSTIIGD